MDLPVVALGPLNGRGRSESPSALLGVIPSTSPSSKAANAIAAGWPGLAVDFLHDHGHGSRKYGATKNVQETDPFFARVKTDLLVSTSTLE